MSAAPATQLTRYRDQLRELRHAMEWSDLHTPGNLAKSVSIEAAELLECFQWSDADSFDSSDVQDEVADVVIYAIQLADICGFSLGEAIEFKMAKNEGRFLGELGR